jgi:hypothetical protein
MGWSFAEAASLFASAQVDDLSDKSGLNCDTLSCTPCLPEGCRFQTRNVHRTRRDARFVQFKNYVALVEELQSKAASSLWLRGCGKRTYCLIPTLYRHDTKRDKEELETLERQLMVRFRQRSIPLHNRSLADEWDMLFFMKHYGVPTQLLDWTENSFVAFHFAVMTSPFSVMRKKGKVPPELSFSSDAAIWASGVTPKPASQGHLKTGQLSASRTVYFYSTCDRSGKGFCVFAFLIFS